jgi:hypothetical protein
MKFLVKVPATKDVGSYQFSVITGSYGWGLSKAKEALWQYNSARAHDGLEPLTRMPNGTTYTATKRGL